MTEKNEMVSAKNAETDFSLSVQKRFVECEKALHRVESIRKKKFDDLCMVLGHCVELTVEMDGDKNKQHDIEKMLKSEKIAFSGTSSNALLATKTLIRSAVDPKTASRYGLIVENAINDGQTDGAKFGEWVRCLKPDGRGTLEDAYGLHKPKVPAKIDIGKMRAEIRQWSSDGEIQMPVGKTLKHGEIGVAILKGEDQGKIVVKAFTKEPKVTEPALRAIYRKMRWKRASKPDIKAKVKTAFTKDLTPKDSEKSADGIDGANGAGGLSAVIS